jgi:hypothetical protein
LWQAKVRLLPFSPERIAIHYNNEQRILTGSSCIKTWVLHFLAAKGSPNTKVTDQVLKSALVLLIDQFEELFAQSDADRTAFAESLKQLIATRRVWCLATLRADPYELLLREPELKGLKEKGATLDFGPPGPAELAEVVRAPAEAARLVFEIEAQKARSMTGCSPTPRPQTACPSAVHAAAALCAAR